MAADKSLLRRIGRSGFPWALEKRSRLWRCVGSVGNIRGLGPLSGWPLGLGTLLGDRKSTRLNSSHLVISYAVFCLKKKTHIRIALVRAHCRLSLSLQSSLFIKHNAPRLIIR